MTIKLFTIVGARPNFMKVDTELPHQFIIHTGQHYDYYMSKVFFKDLHIPTPACNLGCDSSQTGMMIDKIYKLFIKEKPNMIIVFGDTNSAMAGALAAAYTNTPLCHIEAGLRSFRTDMPEEINRVLIDKIARLRICPKHYCINNLNAEGLKDNNFVLGDPSFVSFGKFLPIPKSKDYRTYNLLTLHRNFNVDNKEILIRIFQAIKESKEKFIFPIHPRTAKNVEKFRIKFPANIKVIKPQNYPKTLALISNAKKVLTDSGGIQREAFWMNVPVIILRDETEWLDIIGRGGGILTGTNKDKILEAIKTFSGKQVYPEEDINVNKKIRETIFKYI